MLPVCSHKKHGFTPPYQGWLAWLGGGEGVTQRTQCVREPGQVVGVKPWSVLSLGLVRWWGEGGTTPRRGRGGPTVSSAAADPR